MPYQINEEIMIKAGDLLSDRKIYWFVGGSCGGKSTISKELQKRLNVDLYDMDEHVFGKYMSRYTPERHPANNDWFTYHRPYEWLNTFKTWEGTNEFNQAANVEYFDLFSEDMESFEKDKILLVDGGITNPVLLSRLIPVEQIVCITTSDEMATDIWETTRVEMKEIIYKLPNPEIQWEKFLRLDHLMRNQIVKECNDNNIKVFYRDENTKVEDLTEAVIVHLGLE